ncbi:MAG: hypothetical protein R2755_16580 [Acidimicrobiales bacterium]
MIDDELDDAPAPRPRRARQPRPTGGRSAAEASTGTRGRVAVLTTRAPA